MGYSSWGRSYRSSGGLAAAVLTRSWDRARRMQEGLAGRGLESGLRVLPEQLPSSRAFLVLAGAGLAGIVAASSVIA
jgi:cobalt/nickel transport system permease protein